MAFAEIQSYVVDRLNTLPGVGQVDAHPGGVLAGEATGALSGFLTVVVRGGTSETARTMGGQTSLVHTVEIHVHRVWDEQDPAGCEAAFDARLEAISDLFRSETTMDGLCALCEPVQWLESDAHFVTIRGALLARWKKGILRVTETKRFGG